MVVDGPNFVEAIENVLSGSLLLESFELADCGDFEKFVIASESMKRLVLRHAHCSINDVGNSILEISCPKLKEFELLCSLNVGTANLSDLPSSLSATIDFYHDDYDSCLDSVEYLTDDEIREIQQSLIKGILQQLRHVKHLKLGSWFIQILSAIEKGDLFSHVLNVKCLTLNFPYFDKYYSGFASMLRNSPVLEQLVIDESPFGTHFDDLPRLNDFEENYWNSNAPSFDCLASHVKTIKIIGFPKRDDKQKLLLSFVQCLLKNARVLEKAVLVLKDQALAFKVSQELLNAPRASQNATVELAPCN